MRTKLRTVRPIRIGGLAGGEKFIESGIMFKFARDWKNIYGGNDNLAAKAADNELRALQIVAYVIFSRLSRSTMHTYATLEPQGRK